jgi:hypothetical protein
MVLQYGQRTRATLGTGAACLGMEPEAPGGATPPAGSDFRPEGGWAAPSGAGDWPSAALRAMATGLNSSVEVGEDSRPATGPEAES